MDTPALDTPSQYQAAIESLPHLVEKATLMWGTRELDAFVHRVILDARDGTRQGLPREAAQELAFLAEINRVVRAVDAAEQLQIDYPEAYKMVVVGDAANLPGDVWSDPATSTDGVFQWKTRPAVNEQIFPATKGRAPGGVVSWLARMLFNRWFLLAVIAILILKIALA